MFLLYNVYTVVQYSLGALIFYGLPDSWSVSCSLIHVLDASGAGSFLSCYHLSSLYFTETLGVTYLFWPNWGSMAQQLLSVYIS